CALHDALPIFALFLEWAAKNLRQELAVPSPVKEQILAQLSQYPRDVLIRQYHLPILEKCAAEQRCGPGCDWRPEDCTIDLELVMRLSAAGTQSIGVASGGASLTVNTPTEDNVRAIADIVQVQSGH